MADPEFDKECIITDERIYVPNDIILKDVDLFGILGDKPDWPLSPYLFVRPGDWSIIETYLSQHPIGDEIQARMFYINLYQYVTKYIKSGPDRDRFKDVLRESPVQPATFITLIEDFRAAVALHESLLVSLRPQFEKTLSSVEFQRQIVNVATKLFSKDEREARYNRAKAALRDTVRKYCAQIAASQPQSSAEDRVEAFRKKIHLQLGPSRTLHWLEELSSEDLPVKEELKPRSQDQQRSAGVTRAAKLKARREKKLAKRAQAALRQAENEKKAFNRSANPSPAGRKVKVKVEPMDEASLDHGTRQLDLPDVDMSEVATQLFGQLRLGAELTPVQTPRRITPTLISGPKHRKQPTRKLGSYLQGNKKEKLAQRRSLRLERRENEAAKRAETEMIEYPSHLKIED